MARKKAKEKKRGRPEQLPVDDLPGRLRDIKLFLENYWGRVSPGLKAARQPEDVRNTLNSVPGIEWWTSFRGHAICLITPTSFELEGKQILVTGVTGKELRKIRLNHKKAVNNEERLWALYHHESQALQQAKTVFVTAVSQFEAALGVFDYFAVISCLASELRLEELTSLAACLDSDLREARKQKERLRNELSAKEAWFAQRELVKFARNRGKAKSLLNFARSMAGLPEWGWFHSRRTCETIEDKATPATPYQLFQLITDITRKMKPLTMTKVEKRLQNELLRPDMDIMLRGYASSHWSYLQEAVQFCKGKDFKRGDLPCKIMDRFLHNLEKPKTIAEAEIAKRNQLVCAPDKT
jgi:hypothetical protein